MFTQHVVTLEGREGGSSRKEETPDTVDCFVL